MKINNLKLYVPFILFMLLLLLFHSSIVTHTNDDIGFAKGLSNLLRFDGENFVVNLYFHWSSRVVTNFFLPILCNLPGEVWKFLDSLLIVITSVLMPRILLNFEGLSIKKKVIYNLISVILFLLFYISSYQYDIQAPAGYITTSLNYVWPLSFGVIHFYLIKQYIDSVKSDDLICGLKRGLIYFLTIFTLVFGINQELMLIIMFGTYIFILLHLFLAKLKIPKIYIISFSIIIFGLLMVYLSPGNRERYIILETALPSSQISLIDKIDVGLNIFFHGLITGFDLISYVFFAILGFYTFSTYKNKKISLFGFLPFIFLNISYLSIYIHFSPVINIFESGKYSFIHSTFSYMSLICLFILLVCFNLVLICYIREKRLVGGLIFCLLFVGFISQFMMGFFPSDFNHEHRWIIFYWGLMLFSSAILIYDLLESINNKNSYNRLTNDTS